jgi:hypothetical protein
MGPYEACNYYICQLLASGSAPSISGSINIIPISGSVYPCHEIADLQTDSISVWSSAAASGTESAFNIRNRVINHIIKVTIRYHSGYDIGPINPSLMTQRMDSIFTLLYEHSALNTNEFMLQGDYTLSMDSNFAESKTRGAELTVTYRKHSTYLLKK